MARALLPATTLRAQLQALPQLGIDAALVAARVGPLPESANAEVPVQQYQAMWQAAAEQYPAPGLPTALAMAIPFGAFGALDYLAGSSDTVAGVLESTALHFAMVTSDTWLELHDADDGARVVVVRGASDLPALAHEFTVAVLLSRLRYVTEGRFEPQALRLPVPRPAHDPVRARLLGRALGYGHPNGEIVAAAADLAMPCPRADPYLHATLTQMAATLQLAQPGDSALERAIRMRLRGALPQGGAEPARIASLLGVSERTLQRRLAEAGHSFSDIVESFRHEEALRLLADPAQHLVHIAARLGYAEQTSFTRAFKRWTGTTPGAWRQGRAG